MTTPHQKAATTAQQLRRSLCSRSPGTIVRWPAQRPTVPQPPKWRHCTLPLAPVMAAQAAAVAPLVAELAADAAAAIDESQFEFLQEIADGIVENMGGGTAKWLLRSSAEELKESIMPVLEDAGFRCVRMRLLS